MGVPCILHTTVTNGAVAGMSVSYSGATGGSWPASGGPYTVQSSGLTGNAIPINLDCTSLGTLSSATLTYNGSGIYVSFLRQNSYLSSQAGAYTTLLYSDLVGTGGKYPSQFTISEHDTQTNVFNFDIYGYFPMASSSSATISGTSMTLGGTIKGIFAAGHVIFGAGVTNGSVVQSIMSSGPGPAGSNSGDVLMLSQSSSIGSGELMSGNQTAIPPAWTAIRAWNKHSLPYLLKRDLSPASNDNSPMWVNEAA
jgi:hypothetical protein